MTSKYHTRKGYEKLLTNILRERGSSWQPDMKGMSDYQLLVSINSELRRSDCIQLTGEELEMELH